ncbi:type II toxin-antitoxin system HipA family toxin [Acidithiobacillus ferrivorans]|uniref:type II toxin-antitoxin system HipA family toxin n=1 Tax=Acidithiobacillus ferrivorans TaxID=160808 RepID=UPI001C07C8D2|nr:type II toxin-antitoxin system HipA family toxin [Acidithiobacillus ferrivorans]MBU2851077.1 type II toxin-antitoxin system HipA family toxin [Acidithiobacillus ferrivorans]
MGRKRKARAVQVYVGSTKVGVYSRTPDGSTLFRYDPVWLASERAFPISLSMPLSDRPWSGMTVSSFFDGLLPDDSTVRDKIASREHAESAGTFDLLAAIGRDCVGALRFIPEEMDPGDSTKMIYRPVSDEEIAARLEALGTSPLGMNVEEDDFRISIAGVQEKTAFLNIDGKWNLPLGPTPTSHIFKPALMQGPNSADFSDTSWNEWLCLELCRALGLEAANAKVLLFGGKPVLMVERFDRRWQDGVLYRLPQEDTCQALGVSPTRKYQTDGGPGIEDILAFLNGAVAPREDRLRFMTAQVVFWLLAAIDGHAKNFSVFLTPGGYKLTPLYDVMSASPYPQLSPHQIKLAMAVGKNRHYRIMDIQSRHFYQTGQAAGLGKQDMDGIFSGLLARIEAALAEVEALAAKAGTPEATLVPILEGVEKRASLIK